MSKGIYSSLTVEGEVELNADLRLAGIPHTIGDLFHDDTLCPERGTEPGKAAEAQAGLSAGSDGRRPQARRTGRRVEAEA